MTTTEAIAQALDSAWNAVRQSTEGLSLAEITHRPTDQTNPIGWIVWHMYRVEDIVIYGVMQRQSAVWITGKWYEKFGLPDDPMMTGGRQTAEEVGKFQCPSPEDLMGYALAVHEGASKYLNSIKDADLEDIVKFFGNDRTRLQALTFIIGEMNQHAGQVAYLRGLIRGMND